MHSYAGDNEDDERRESGTEPEFVGGPLVPGVDYEGAWLSARAAAEALNCAMLKAGLTRALMRAQAGWAEDGTGVVYISGTPLGARKLGEVLERMAARRRGAARP
ncbi:hypothetical protein ABUW04_16085 [Streptacidiphilus sp. N1-10]|uniref:Uncharacterized protein n=1 Tax=Streptacidiphilus jeojiensis TaxID=3229225 RepID=A0ABV6XP28_9ACTN